MIRTEHFSNTIKYWVITGIGFLIIFIAIINLIVAVSHSNLSSKRIEKATIIVSQVTPNSPQEELIISFVDVLSEGNYEKVYSLVSQGFVSSTTGKSFNEFVDEAKGDDLKIISMERLNGNEALVVSEITEKDLSDTSVYYKVRTINSDDSLGIIYFGIKNEDGEYKVDDFALITY